MGMNRRFLFVLDDVVGIERFRDDVLDGHPRIERTIRILEDHLGVGVEVLNVVFIGFAVLRVPPQPPLDKPCSPLRLFRL
jgi:hypothetical protein